MKTTHLFFLLVLPLLCQGYNIPITGSGLEIMDSWLEHNINIEAYPRMPEVTRNFRLPVDSGSVLSYDQRTVTGGNVIFKGGIVFSNHISKIAITKLVFNIRTGVITAMVGSTPNHPFGKIDVSTVRMIKYQGSTTLLIFTMHPINTHQKMISAINEKFGTSLSTLQWSQNNTVSFEVDLALGTKINADLVNALGLGSVIDLSKGKNALLGIDFTSLIQWQNAVK